MHMSMPANWEVGSLAEASIQLTAIAGDASTLTVAGTSAGGLIAAAVTLKAMRLNYPPIQHQVLVVPMLAPMSASASYLR
jgi:acetyl esterase/lipase